MKRALFLDRDGVVNVDRGYVHKPEHVEFVDGIFDVARAFAEKDFLTIIITNQAGIGRGYYTEETFRGLMRWMATKFEAAGGRIDAVYHCPHHPDHGVGAYKTHCACRKPAPGMLFAAIREHGIDPARSVLIGDKTSDIRAGEAAGVGALLLLSPSEELTNGAQRIASLKAAAGAAFL